MSLSEGVCARGFLRLLHKASETEQSFAAGPCSHQLSPAALRRAEKALEVSDGVERGEAIKAKRRAVESDAERRRQKDLKRKKKEKTKRRKKERKGSKCVRKFSELLL